MQRKGNPGTPSFRGAARARHRTPLLIRNGVVLVALGLFAAAAALAVVKPQAELPPVVHHTEEALALPELLTPIGHADEAPYISETQIRRGDTLAALLQRLRINDSELQKFLTHDKNARSIYKLYPGRTLQAALNRDGELVWLRYNHAPGRNEDDIAVARWLEVRPDDEGGYVAEERERPAHRQVRIAESEIESSLFGAADAADIPDGITMQMIDILGSKIDFLKDLRQGDRFRLVYETFADSGKTIGAGRVLALEFINQGNTYEAVWFDADDERGGNYFDFSGRSLKGAFLRTALKYTRISSTFGIRRHPLHNTWRSHNGVDYAAASGTPIHATADGVVKFIGQQRGYGNVIILQHQGETTTLYAHQSRFAKGLKKGSRVAQGDLIGYVGATGWATGPHLHYEFRVAGKPVDPLSVDLPVARVLDPSDRPAFEQTVAQFRQQVELVAGLQENDVALATE